MTRWGMVIDLDRCAGCQTCTVACRTENNVPSCGDENAWKGRAIFWNKVITVRMDQHGEELEGTPRDAYTGSMGYLGRDGSLDLNILIRTLAVRDGTIEFRTGAGIVADSRPEAELEETRAKARGLLRALGSNA